jgi:hypothetical protein
MPQYCLGSPIDEAINETLNKLHPYVPNNIATKNLLRLTAAVESDNGKNINNKSSIGVFQLTGATIKYVQNYICQDENLYKIVAQLKEKSINHYHAALAIIYYGIRVNLFELKITKNVDNIDLLLLSLIWKNEYNTYKGAGNVFIAIYKYKLYY